MKNRLRSIGVNTAIVAISCLIALLFCEWAIRLMFDPVDYLSPQLVRDPVFGIRLPPHSSGHDAWGFRNKKVPKQAAIVAVGDSHTYGNCAKANEAWPAVLAKLTGKPVYNLGMGGYGPNQYMELLKTKALNLRPQTVICGLYLGDDFDNAYRITYGLPHWHNWRGTNFGNVDPDIWQRNDAPRLSTQKRVRNWLSGHSVLYRVVVHGVLANAKERVKAETAARSGTVALLEAREKNLREAFLPVGVLRGLNQEAPSVREGMRITMDLLREMNTLCSSNGARFVVAVIPTKESVFANYLQGNTNLAMSEVVSQVVSNERLARAQLFSTLQAEKIAFVDLLAPLRAASEKEKLYTPSISDMHPNNNGYRVIAETVQKFVSGS